MVSADATKANVPQLFLFFGCGALSILFGVLTTAEDLVFQGLLYLAVSDNVPASFGLILSPLLIFLCYVIGTSVAFLGYNLVAISHSSWITKFLDFEVHAIKHGDNGLLNVLSGPYANFLPLYAGIGFGFSQFIIQIGAGIFQNSNMSFGAAGFSIVVSTISYLALRWRVGILCQMCEKSCGKHIKWRHFNIIS